MELELIYKLRAILFICIISISLISCDDDITSLDDNILIIKDSSSIKTLAIANSWTYDVYEYDKSGNTVKFFQSLHQITEKYDVEGESWYLEEQSNPSEDLILYLMNDKNGLWKKTNLDSSKSQIVAFPAKLHQDVLMDTLIYGNNKFVVFRKTIAINEIVKTPSGKYTCVVYEDRLENLDGEVMFDLLNRLYYSQNVGLVKSERFSYSKNERYLEKMSELINKRVYDDKSD